MRLAFCALAACLLLAWSLWPEPPREGKKREGKKHDAQAPGMADAPPPLLQANGVARAPAPRASVPKPRRRWRIRRPRDPIERGSSELTLHLTNRDGRPVHTRVTLWRIGAPGNVDYKAGDQEVAYTYSPEGTARFQGLAEGSYRIYAHAARVGGQDPPAFAVRGAHTEQHVELDTPERFPIYVQLVDAQRGRTTYSRPQWKQPRRLRQEPHPEAWFFGGGTIGIGGRRVGGAPTRTQWEEPRPVSASVRGFEIAREEALSRAGGWITRWEVRYGTHGHVALRVHPPPGRAVTLRGPALTLETLREAVFLPDGRNAAAAGASFQVFTEVVPVPVEGEAPDVRAMPIDVVVRLKGYRRLLVTWFQRGPLPRWVMEKRSTP